jgi:hypothetical protein
MLRIVESLASRWHSARWAFAAIAGCSLLAVLVVSVSGNAPSEAMYGAIFAALFSFFWALFLMCAWFHPTLGAFASNARLGGSWPFARFSPLSAARFLLIFVICGAVVVPAVIWFMA